MGSGKGYGHFQNDRSLTQEQIELFAVWVEGGMRKGNNAGMLPPTPTVFPTAEVTRVPRGSLLAGRDFTLTRDFTADGLLPQNGTGPGQRANRRASARWAGDSARLVV